MELTKEEAIANHRKMWNWIADETLKQKRKVEKSEHFKAHGITDVPLRECYCCEYVRCSSRQDCPRCPIDWGGDYGECTHKNRGGDRKGLFSLWRCEPNYIKAAELAKQIAELPERK